MKYRELTPNEIEAYNIGYKVGNRQIVITDVEWESENEHKIYRKGYMAGLMDYKRNVSNVKSYDNVSNVSNVEIETSTTPIGIRIRKGNKERDKERDKEREYAFVDENNPSTNSFIPPKDAVEVYEYALVNGMICSMEQAQNFFDYYSGIGWRLGNEFRTPMQDWHPFVRKWLRNPLENKFKTPNPQRITMKEMKAAENHIKLQKMLKGDL